MTTASTKKPAHKIRRGAIELAIWENTGANGVWYNVTLSRSFKKDDQWGESSSFGQDDLLPLAKILDEADSWIQGAQQSARKAA
jgi:hypothetical protein